MLKDRWRILLKCIDMLLPHVGDIVLACIFLHNFCIIHGDKFNKSWAKKVEFELLQLSRQKFTTQLQGTNTFSIVSESIKQMKILQLQTQEAIPFTAYDGDDLENVESPDFQNELPKTKSYLKMQPINKR